MRLAYFAYLMFCTFGPFVFLSIQEMVNALRQELVTKGNSLEEVRKFPEAVKDVSTMYIFTIKFAASGLGSLVKLRESSRHFPNGPYFLFFIFATHDEIQG